MVIEVFILVVIVLLLIVFYIYRNYNKKTIVINDEKFQVNRKYKDNKKAAHLMNDLNRDIIRYISHLKSKSEFKYITDNLKYRYNPSNFVEGRKSFTVRKGKKISLCLRDNEGNLYDRNLLMFVLLHELSHVAINSKNHTEEFWNTFKLILREASSYGIYQPTDYSKNPTMYCGIRIKYNPFYG